MLYQSNNERYTFVVCHWWHGGEAVSPPYTYPTKVGIALPSGVCSTRAGVALWRHDRCNQCLPPSSDNLLARTDAYIPSSCFNWSVASDGKHTPIVSAVATTKVFLYRMRNLISLFTERARQAEGEMEFFEHGALNFAISSWRSEGRLFACPIITFAETSFFSKYIMKHQIVNRICERE